VIANILEAVSHWIISVIEALHYFGVVLLIAIESACIPLPSEIILPFSGYLVSQGKFNLHIVAFLGAFGCVLGSLLAYYVGKYGGERLIRRYGKYILISPHDLEIATKWFQKYGQYAALFGRMLPIVRTFISLPAGIAKVEIKKFLAFTFLGSLPWCYFLVYIGQKLGENWASIRVYFHRFDYLIGALIVIGIVGYIYMHIRNNSNHKQK